MLIDITLPLTPEMQKGDTLVHSPVGSGHIGTHFDVMNKIFPLEMTKRKGIVFDVRGIVDRDIEKTDFDIALIKRDMFVCFFTGWIEKYSYGSKEYFTDHPQLSMDLINELTGLGISMIAVDCSGIRRGAEHSPADQFCADRDVFVIENVCSIESLLPYTTFDVNVYPLNFTNMSGLPCRIIAEV